MVVDDDGEVVDVATFVDVVGIDGVDEVRGVVVDEPTDVLDETDVVVTGAIASGSSSSEGRNAPPISITTNDPATTAPA